MKKIRIAHVIGKMGSGGVESVIMNYFRNINKEMYEFTFIVDADSTLPQKEEILNLGGKIMIVPKYQKLPFFLMETFRVFKREKFDIVHSHLNTLSVFPLSMAWLARIRVRIAHNHSTSNNKEFLRNIIKNILKPLPKLFATHYFACTKSAGEYLFGKKNIQNEKVTIINNAIELNNFQFNLKTRNKIRKELKIEEDTIVIGHIGRFTSQKNHDFIIDIFSEYHKCNKNTKLLLIGEGPLQHDMVEKVNLLNLNDEVIFYGTTLKPQDLYSAMDLFLFPSLYEGLGMVAVEAQVATLPSLVSTEVPNDAKITDLITFLPLENSPKIWVDTIIEMLNQKKSRKNNLITADEYDIKKECKKLENIYSKLINELGDKK